MEPIAPLMQEHRLIEEMVRILGAELDRLVQDRKLDERFVVLAVDFFRTYADRTHHGKEEAILFRDLSRKPLSPEHRQTLDELLSDHNIARTAVSGLLSARDAYVAAPANSLAYIIADMRQIVSLYPAHIQKEELRLFYPCMAYLSSEEQERMLQEFWEFDRSIIHNKYRAVVDELGRKPG